MKEPQELVFPSYQNKKDEIFIVAPSGLPNIGNTCFLNSAIQQLYRIQIIQKILVERVDAQGYDLLSKLKKIFMMMNTNQNTQEKKRELKIIKNIMKETLLDYIPGQGYDSFQTFFIILDNFLVNYPELQKYFQMQFSQICVCKQTKFQQFIIQNRQMRCSSCEGSLKRKITKFPQYIIVRFSDKQKDSLLFKDFSEKDKYFKVQSKNIYIGNGRSGHYYAQCIYNDQLYTYNDGFVSQGNSHEHNSSLFAVYKKTYIQFYGSTIRQNTNRTFTRRRRFISRNLNKGKKINNLQVQKSNNFKYLRGDFNIIQDQNSYQIIVQQPIKYILKNTYAAQMLGKKNKQPLPPIKAPSFSNSTNKKLFLKQGSFLSKNKIFNQDQKKLSDYQQLTKSSKKSSQYIYPANPIVYL